MRMINLERFSLGGAAHMPFPAASAAGIRAGERKTYWANPLAPQPRPSPGDPETDAAELIYGAMVVNIGRWRLAERWDTR